MPILVPVISGFVVICGLLVGLFFGAQVYSANREAKQIQEDMAVWEGKVSDEVRQGKMFESLLSLGLKEKKTLGLLHSILLLKKEGKLDWRF